MIVEPTVKALALGKKVQEVKQRVADRFNAALKPDSSMLQYSSQEIERRLKEQQGKAIESNKADLQYVAKEVNAELENTRAEIEKTLRPLQFSLSAQDQQAGRYWEDRASRIVKTVGVAKIEPEYSWAMQNKLTDYATELLSWSEMSAKLEEEATILRLKQHHAEAIGLTPQIADQVFLQQKSEELANSLKMVEVGMFYTREQVKGMSQGEVVTNLAHINASMSFWSAEAA